MCRLLFGCDKRLAVDTIELERGEKSYTVDTLRELKLRHPDGEMFLIIGSDMLDTFTQWYKYEEILSLATVCAARRTMDYTPDLSQFTEAEKERIVYFTADPIEISSTEIRETVAHGGDISGVVSPSVAEYIAKNGLYRGYDSYVNLIRQKLDDYRFYHSLCVAESAKELAVRYGADPQKAYLAGLLHDVMKNAPRQEQRSAIEKAGLLFTKSDEENPKIWHAIAGEAFLRTEKTVEDEEVLSAVRWHTTGRAGMTLLDKIVYIADFISADRNYPDVGIVREKAKKSLESAIKYTSEYTIKKVSSDGRVPHPATVDCYNEMNNAEGE